VDLTEWVGYSASKAGFRHFDQAVVGWLDGHVKTHPQGFVGRRADDEEGRVLEGNDRLLYWNRI
jgi:prepilin-type processing-associated H-X9-DG protein